jgi:group I intron endonuclease
MIGIYKITNPKGRVYIGQSIDIEKRFKTYKREFGIGQSKLFNSFSKYGSKAHSFEIIVECDTNELSEKERYYQEIFNCVKQGLNCNLVKTDTRSGKVSEETRLKMVKAQTGNKKWLGRKHTEETKAKMRVSMTGLKRSEEFNLAMSLRKKGKPTGMISPNTRIVLDTLNGIYYDSLKEASKSSLIKYSTLKSHLTAYKVNRTNFIYV